MTELDPFADADKAPALSFKDQPAGTVRTIDVSEPARLVQQSDYDTGKPSYWDPNETGKKTTVPNDKPCMAAVYNGVGADGSPASLWAPKPSDLFAKLTIEEKAYRAKGAPIGGGSTIDRISVRLEGRVPGKNERFTKSVYAVKVESIGPKATQAAPAADPWASEPASAGNGSMAGAAPFSAEPPF